MAKAFECQVCNAICGSFREHCHVCGASRDKVFWLVDGPNSWAKSQIDVDRPIHRSSGAFRNTRITPIDGVIGMNVVDDVVLMLARELAENQQ